MWAVPIQPYMGGGCTNTAIDGRGLYQYSHIWEGAVPIQPYMGGGCTNTHINTHNREERERGRGGTPVQHIKHMYAPQLYALVVLVTVHSYKRHHCCRKYRHLQSTAHYWRSCYLPMSYQIHTHHVKTY